MPPPSGSTPVLHVPYPIPDDTVDVPRDIKAVADWLELNTGGGASGGGPILRQAPVLDVGQSGQVRAGRQLTAADFTRMGLSAPAGLWNLSDLSDASGFSRALTNKGAVPFGVGINGFSTSAAVFAGSTGQALFIADTGAADPFCIRTGSWGCWFRTAKRGTSQRLMAKMGPASTNLSWGLAVNSANQAMADASSTGGVDVGFYTQGLGVSDVADDRWHLVVATFDATAIRLYVDGVLEAINAFPSMTIVAAPSPVNIGGRGADGATAAAEPFYGRVDEAFVTPDVLTDDQIRNLYCATVPHTLPNVPARVTLNVTRRRRGAALTVGDFPSSPVRLHNFTNGALTDEGSNGVALTNTGGAVAVAGADGSVNGAFSFTIGVSYLSATDAGLPSGTAARSYGCWFKSTSTGATLGVMSWGASGQTRLLILSGALAADNTSDRISGPFVADGQWHHAAIVEDNASGDGVRRKMYLDGRLVGGSTILNATTLAGANAFQVGRDVAGNGFTGQIDGAFVYAAALTAEQVWTLYNKAGQALAPSPKEPGAHTEAFEAARVLTVFDTLEATELIDLGVAA